MKRISLVIPLILMLTGNVFADWDKAQPAGSASVSDIDTLVQANNTALDRGMAQVCNIGLVYSSASAITATTGSCVVQNSDGSVRVYLNNTSTTSVGWADIDTGAEAGSTTYYVYAIAASVSSTTATFKISTSSTAPSGVTYYAKIGSFYNNSSSDIDRTKIYSAPYRSAPTDSSGTQMVQAIYDYGTSASSFTSKTGGLLVAFGTISSLGADTSQAITNMPFSSSSSYSCDVTIETTSVVLSEPVNMVRNSGSQFTIYNSVNATETISWICIGY